MSGEIRRTGGNGRRSSCVAHGGTLYISGITTVALEEDTAGQAKDILAQLDRLMAHHGTNKNNLLSVTVYLRDMADYGDFNGVWDEWITDGHEPARTSVQAGLSLPEYRLKISAIAAL